MENKPLEMIEWLRIAALLGLIVALVSIRMKVGYVLLIVAAAVPCLFAWREFPTCLLRAGSNAAIALSPTREGWDFWKLLIIVLSITTLGNILKETENIPELIGALSRLFGTRTAALAGLPAIIGFLPMPGGALLSAPMVEEAAEDGLSPERKSLINYWFRHIWEYTLPVYPGLIVLAEITGLPMRRLVLANLPLTLAALAVGILYCLRGVENRRPRSALTAQKALSMIFIALLPVIFVVFANVGLGVKLELVVPVTVASLLAVRIIRLPAVGRVLRESCRFELIVLVAGVIVFKRMLDVFDVGASVTPALASLGAPRTVVLFVVPLTIGVLAGYMVAPVSICTPLLMAFLITGGEVNPLLTMLLYAGGHLGVMLSPVHLCLVLTREYFAADLKTIYRWLLIPIGAVAGTAVLNFLIRSQLR